MKQLTEQYIKDLIKIAQRSTWDEDDDFNPYDFSGGNFDDAYQGGSRDGETWAARNLLHALDISYEQGVEYVHQPEYMIAASDLTRVLKPSTGEQLRALVVIAGMLGEKVNKQIDEITEILEQNAKGS